MLLEGGWTIVEKDWTDDVGYVSYWLMSPLDEEIETFCTIGRAKAYWKAHKSELLQTSLNKGKALAESCGVKWSKLTDFEIKTWVLMAQKHGEVI